MIGFTFRQLKYFIAAEQGRVSVAARTKHISQPSVLLWRAALGLGCVKTF